MQEKQQIVPLQYVITTVFGLIHGMGFSNYFKAILGKEASIFQPLLAFNLGVELGQLIIVSLFLTFTFVVINLGNVRRSYWTIPVSALSALVAVYLLLQR
jgi:ABC-type antimicrobial peptide transport system permease subunit